MPKTINDWSLRILQVKLVKIGGRFVHHARQIIFQLIEVAVSRDLFAAILIKITRLCPSLGLEQPRRFSQPSEKYGDSMTSFGWRAWLALIAKDYEYCRAQRRLLTIRYHGYTIGDRAMKHPDLHCELKTGGILCT